MAINFPATPANGATYVYGNKTWVYSTATTPGTWTSVSTNGAQGVQGYNGSTGIQGRTGLQGTQGPIGASGSQGTSGAQGLGGIQGLLGTTGNTGAQGATGAQGNQGTQGLQGLQGLQGTQGVGYSGITSSTSATPAATGTITLTTNGQGAFVTGDRVRAINTTSNYFEGQVTITGGTSFAITADYNVGVTTATAWTITLTGGRGVQGTQGTQGTQGIQGTGYSIPASATSNTIGTGAKTFAVTNTGSYVIGDYVRVINTGVPANYMEGQITTLTANTSMIVTVTLTGGSGTFTAWTISLAGLQGVQGIQGTQGLQGGGFNQLQGLQGLQGTAGTAQGTQGLQGTVGSAGSTASPTFTGTVTMPTGTTSVAPELYVAGGPLNTPVTGAFEYDGNVWYQTPNTTAGRAPVDLSYFNTISTSQPAPLRNTTGAQAMFGAWQAASGTLGTPTGTGPWTVVITAIPTGQTGFRPGTNITATAGTGSFNTNTVTVVSVDSATQITVSATGGTIPTAGTVTLITSTTTGAMTVPANTTYLIEVVANILATGQTGTNLLQFGFGGTATISYLQYESTYGPQTAIGTAGTPRVLMQSLTAGTMTNMYSTAATSLANPFTIKGLIRIGASSGTLIPQVGWSAAATTGVCSIVQGSYIRLTPIGSNTVVTSGAWT